MIWKYKKNINLKQRKKLKIFNFFKSAFETQKETGFYETQLKKHVKTAFQTQFFSELHSIKHSLVCYQTPYCVCFTANTKWKTITVNISYYLTCISILEFLFFMIICKMKHSFFLFDCKWYSQTKTSIKFIYFSNNCKSTPNTSTWYIQSKFNKFLDTALTLKITKWDLNIIVGL
jgi:hypothetical protein